MVGNPKREQKKARATTRVSATLAKSGGRGREGGGSERGGTVDGENISGSDRNKHKLKTILRAHQKK